MTRNLATKKQFVMLFETNPLKTFSVQRFPHSDGRVDWESADSVQVSASCCITSSSSAPAGFFIFHFFFFFKRKQLVLQHINNPTEHIDLGVTVLSNLKNYIWESPEILQKCHADLGMNRLWVVTLVVKPSCSCFPASFLPYISGEQVKFGYISHSFLLATNLPTMKLCWLCVRAGAHSFR